MTIVAVLGRLRLQILALCHYFDMIIIRSPVSQSTVAKNRATSSSSVSPLQKSHPTMTLVWLQQMMRCASNCNCIGVSGRVSRGCCSWRRCDIPVLLPAQRCGNDVRVPLEAEGRQPLRPGGWEAERALPARLRLSNHRLAYL